MCPRGTVQVGCQAQVFWQALVFLPQLGALLPFWHPGLAHTFVPEMASPGLGGPLPF